MDDFRDILKMVAAASLFEAIKKAVKLFTARYKRKKKH
jgi:hypothetical protein